MSISSRNSPPASRIAALWVMTTVVVPRAALTAASASGASTPGNAVEGTGRLVAWQHLPALGDGPGDRHPLLLAAESLARKCSSR